MTEAETELTHLDASGNARMVNVSGKAPTDRRAVARCIVTMTSTTASAVLAGDLPKGDVPNDLQEELLSQLHAFDTRLYFQLCTNTDPHELIITADGNAGVFPVADKLVDAAPTLPNWKFISLKPAISLSPFSTVIISASIDMDAHVS